MPPSLSLAPDILQTPSATVPRYAAYVRARHRFWDAFPEGRYARLPTPGTDLECGLHALILSVRHQHQHPSSSAVSVPVPVPTLAELRAVVRALGLDGDGGNWFTADQLAAVFAEWGRARGLRCQMGWVVDEEVDGRGWPVMMNTPEVETGEVGEGIVRVWVWNDGTSLRGGIGHFEGVRRLTVLEVLAAEERERREREVRDVEKGQSARDDGGGEGGQEDERDGGQQSTGSEEMRTENLGSHLTLPLVYNNLATARESRLLGTARYLSSSPLLAPSHSFGDEPPSSPI